MFELKAGMDRYVIDFTDVSRANDFHDIIRDALDFPDWYGKNWDALWDLLSDMAIGGDPTHIEIRGLDHLRNFYEPAIEPFISILKDYKHYRNDKYAKLIRIEIVDGDNITEIE